MRVISGNQRGKSLVSPEHLPLRPTSNKVRAALFNILRPKIREARFLDLFAGTGAIGINALSEGASHVTFVEKNPSCLTALIKNVEQVGFCDKVVIKKIAVERFVQKSEEMYYSFVFMDPPYAYTIPQFLEVLYPLHRKTPSETVIFVEHTRDLDLEPLCERIGFLFTCKHYSHTQLSILTKPC